MKISTILIIVACVLVVGLAVGGIVYAVKHDKVPESVDKAVDEAIEKATELYNDITNKEEKDEETETSSTETPSENATPGTNEGTENTTPGAGQNSGNNVNQMPDTHQDTENNGNNESEKPEIAYASNVDTIVGNVRGAISNDTTLTLETRKAFWCIGADEATVTVTANPNAPDFVFIVDDEFVSMKDIADFTQCFGITKLQEGTHLAEHEYRFSLFLHSSIETIGQTMFPNSTVTIMEDKDFLENAYFLLNVTIGEDAYSFPLKVDISRNVHAVVLEPKEIVF